MSGTADVAGEREPDWQALEAAGLWDPAAPGAGDRRRLLEHLVQRGASVEQMADAAEGGYLRSLAGDLLLSGEPRYSLATLAETAGITMERAEAAVRATGFAISDPHQVAYTDQDLHVLRLLAPALDLFPHEVALQMLRVISSSLARIADAAVAAYLDNVERAVIQRGDSEIEHAESVDRAMQIMGGAVDAMGPMLAHHLEQAIHRSRASRSVGGAYDSARLAVGFVDLAGFTPLSLSIPLEEVGELVAIFEARAADLITEHDGRMVKVIGDEVMFVATDPASACAIALELVDTFRSGEQGVMPRGGIAYGEVVTRGGDYFGPEVNLASRVAGEAVPLEILVSDNMRVALSEDFAQVVPPRVAELRSRVSRDDLRCVPAGRRMLKGFADPVPVWTLERAPGSGSG